MAPTNCSVQVPPFVHGTTQYHIRQFVFPLISIFGVFGNILNIIILRRMKAKSNLFLILIAVADLCFFFPSFILNLGVYENLSSSEDFLRIYFNITVYMLALSNWFSSASIWFAIMVTVERLIAIKTPLKAHIFWNKCRLWFVIITIWVLTLVVQLPQFFWFIVQTKPNCADQTKSAFLIKPIPPYHKHYTVIKAFYTPLPVIIIIIPLTLLVVLNTFLIYYLRMNHKSLVQLGCSNQNGYNTERKVTKRILLVLILCFVFNFPSAVLFLWTTFEKNKSIWKILVDFPAFVSTLLVTLSKATNFVVYCCVNANFRKHLKLFFIEIYQFLSMNKERRESVTTSKNCWKMCDTTFVSNMANVHRASNVGFGDHLELIALV